MDRHIVKSDSSARPVVKGNDAKGGGDEERESGKEVEKMHYGIKD